MTSPDEASRPEPCASSRQALIEAQRIADQIQNRIDYLVGVGGWKANNEAFDLRKALMQHYNTQAQVLVAQMR